jgi:Ca-activated chloride channel family protein
MQEANKVFGKEFGGTLFTIAKDVKIQVEFNPTKVQAYRLIGYENRLLNDEDFKDDTKDAGELGSGHTVTALYEIIPIGVKSKFIKDIDGLKYTKSATNTQYNDELFTVKFRYKKPNGEKSVEMVYTQNDNLSPMSTDFSFASSVALFGMQLKKSEFHNKSSVADVLVLAERGRGKDEQGYRAEFIRLLKLNNNL